MIGYAPSHAGVHELLRFADRAQQKGLGAKALGACLHLWLVGSVGTLVLESVIHLATVVRRSAVDG
jgi:hypothetical protein